MGNKNLLDGEPIVFGNWEQIRKIRAIEKKIKKGYMVKQNDITLDESDEDVTTLIFPCPICKNKIYLNSDGDFDEASCCGVEYRYDLKKGRVVVSN